MKYIVTVNGKKYEVEVEEIGTSGENTEVAASKVDDAAAWKKPSQASNLSGKEVVKAPMPGTILDVKVKEGQMINRGDVLLILEAMKMENEIMAGVEGTISSISVSRGDSVNIGDVLLTID